MISFLKKKALTLTILFFSALGFSMGLFLARVFGSVAAVENVLVYQSTIALFAFVLQCGFRASLRSSIYKNRKKIVHFVQIYLILFLAVISIIGVLFQLFFSVIYFVSASCVLAVVTLKFTLSVAMDIKRDQILFGALNFIICFYGSMLYVLLESPFIAGIWIELISIVIMVVLVVTSLYSIQFEIDQLFLKRKFNVFIRLICLAQSFQLGSGVIFLMIYSIIQYVVFHYSDGPEVLLLADIQLIAGGLALLTSQLLLVFEKTIYDQTAIRLRIFRSLTLIQLVCIVMLCFYASYFYSVELWYPIVVSFMLTSRTSFGYIVQYINKGRVYLNFMFSAFLVYFLCLNLIPYQLSITFQMLPAVIGLAAGYFFLASEETHD